MPAKFLRHAATFAVALAMLAFAPGAVAEEVGSASNAPVRAGLSSGRSQAPVARPVGVMINHRLTQEQALVVVMEDLLFVRRADLVRTGLILPSLASEFVLEGHDYVALSRIEGLSASLSDGGTSLDIAADPAIFPATRMGSSTKPVKVGDIVPAAFISYDLTFSRWNGQNSLFAFLDAGVSGDWGLIGTTAAVQNHGHTAVRLDSYFQRDWPDDRLRLVIGDTVTKATEWSASARFAGIRIGTDFSLQPTLITFPLPVLTEAATLPSTVDLISAASRQSLGVQPGAFSIDYQPVFSGAGDITMMITDANGLSRQVTSSFYTSPRLLRPGLVDFSIEAGVVRRNYGIESFDYGPPFAAGFLRFGLNDAMTLGSRVEVGRDIRMGGLGLGWVVSPLGEFALSGALSDSPWGRGTLWRAQFQRIAPTHALTISYQRDNGRFAQVGNVNASGTPFGPARQEFAVAGSLSLGALGDIVVGHAETRTATGQTFTTSSLGLNGEFRTAFYNIGVRRNRFGDRSDNGGFLSVSLPLGARSNAVMTIDDARAVAMVGLATPSDLGAGYQVMAGYDRVSDRAILQASTLVRTSAGEFELALGRGGGGPDVRMGARGAIVGVSGNVIATPRLENAFALIEIESGEDVTLYLENRPVPAKAGSGKNALLTGLQPYAQNRIAIDVSSLPITADVEESEKLVVPGFRQAVRVGFGGAAQTPVTVRLVDAQGIPLAAGLEVRSGTEPAGITGYDGLFFLSDLHGGEQFVVTGPAFRCEAQIPVSPKIEDNRQVGPLVCLPRPAMEPNP